MLGATASGATNNLGALTLLLVSFVAFIAIRGRLQSYIALAASSAGQDTGSAAPASSSQSGNTGSVAPPAAPAAPVPPSAPVPPIDLWGTQTGGTAPTHIGPQK